MPIHAPTRTSCRPHPDSTPLLSLPQVLTLVRSGLVEEALREVQGTSSPTLSSLVVVARKLARQGRGEEAMQLLSKRE